MALEATTRVRLLALDTSGATGHVALAEGMQIQAERRLDPGRRHARDLAPTVNELLQQCGWLPGTVDAVVISAGPGSYTGLRVGFISAMTFAYATGCAFLAVPTFQVIAWAVPVAEVEIVEDAQQERIYTQLYRRMTEQDPVALSPLRIVTLEEWLRTRAPVPVTGPGLRLYRPKLPASVTILDQSYWDPSIGALVALGYRRYCRGERDDLWRAEPIYGRPSDAEEKWARRQTGQAQPRRPEA